MMKNKYKVVLSLVLVLGLGVFTAGCGNTQVTGEDHNSNSLTIAVVTKDMYLDTAVQKFEELHPGISVEVKEYTSSTTEKGEGLKAEEPGDIEKYVTAVNTQLMSGQGSDIILLNNLPYQTYADKNLLVDLGHLMQSDQSFDSGKYYQNIFKALEYEDKLYRLPLNISIDVIAADITLLADSQVQIDDSNWEWNDFTRIAEKVMNDNQNGDTQEMYALAGMDERRLMATLVKENYDKLVNPEKKTANFTGQEFLDLLSLSKYLIDHKLVNTDIDQTNIMDMAARGKLVFNFTPLGGFWELQVAKAIFSEGVQLLKPPGNVSFSTDAMYGISSQSSNQELAWEFLKFLVSDDMMAQGGMPINKSVLPQIAQNFTQAIQKRGGKMIIKEDGIPGQSITLQPPTQEDVDYMENLLSQANVYIETDQQIISIVQEETAAFLTGQKTAETTAQLIQDRVSTYLNE
ncbi:MAG: ABC transporter substrate-binding protein [Gracilibacter sp. BRH_c7a]|nr:MAG: ABC transporter substrate-binding protein [Gracilibacter sp. BRH_c7a]